MKKIYIHMMMLAAMVVAGAAMTSCQKEEAVTGKFSMTVNATMAGGNTKALSEGEHTINATWAVGERVTVYNETKHTALGGYLEAQSEGASTTLNGTLEGTIADNDVLTLKFCSPNYTSQDGTLAYIAANCDYATATVTVASVGGGVVKTQESSAAFVNQQAIVKFTLTDNASTPAALNVTQLVVSDGANSYTVTPATATNVLYVAIPATNTISLTATVGSDTYTYEKTNAGLTAGQYYEITVKMTEVVPLATPLTLEALTSGTIKVNIADPLDDEVSLEYSVNNGEKTLITTTTTIPVNAGDKVQFYGNGNSTQVYGGGPVVMLQGTAQTKVYGNIMSLIDETGYATLTTQPNQNNVFKGLFFENTELTDASGLLLPATTLAGGCYFGMFYGCTSLTTAPALPATTLAEDCYSSMFYGCTSLTTAPALPAMMLAGGCYSYMFSGCTSLVTAPALPAMMLAGGCYSYMFSGCTSLTTAPTLPATTLAEDCYYNMFDGCTSLTTAPALPATTLTEYCYKSMFSGCTSLTAAPALPATTLVEGCYYEMFKGCTRLNNITCLATAGINQNQSTSNWVNSVASTGTFTKASGATWLPGNNGIPNGWTVNEQ